MLLRHGGIPIWWLEVYVKALGKTFHEELSPPFLSLSDFSKNKNPSYKGNENVFVQFAMDIPWCLGKPMQPWKNIFQWIFPYPNFIAESHLKPSPNYQLPDILKWSISLRNVLPRIPEVPLSLYISIPTSLLASQHLSGNPYLLLLPYAIMPFFLGKISKDIEWVLLPQSIFYYFIVYMINATQKCHHRHLPSTISLFFP